MIRPLLLIIYVLIGKLCQMLWLVNLCWRSSRSLCDSYRILLVSKISRWRIKCWCLMHDIFLVLCDFLFWLLWVYQPFNRKRCIILIQIEIIERLLSKKSSYYICKSNKCIALRGFYSYIANFSKNFKYLIKGLLKIKVNYVFNVLFIELELSLLCCQILWTNRNNFKSQNRLFYWQPLEYNH